MIDYLNAVKCGVKLEVTYNTFECVFTLSNLFNVRDIDHVSIFTVSIENLR